jgi:hypothetical protein
MDNPWRLNILRKPPEGAIMPRTTSIDAILRDAAEKVVSRVSTAIARQVGELVQERLQAELASGALTRRGAGRRRRPRGEITKWVADVRARRVPNFVIEMTSLDTKKKIVQKYGPNATFELGKAPPKPKS